MTPDPLEVSRDHVRDASEMLRIVCSFSRERLAEHGEIGANLWKLLEHRAERLVALLGELERVERAAGLR